MTYILYIDKNSDISEEEIDRIVKIHETKEDPVVKIYTTDKLYGGFVITKDDNLVSDVEKSKPKIADDREASKIIRKQNKFLREQAKFTGDQSLLKGEKEYGKVRSREKDKDFQKASK